jgi:hypothetical protein
MVASTRSTRPSFSPVVPVVEVEALHLDRARPELRVKLPDLGADVVLLERRDDLARDQIIDAARAIEQEREDGDEQDERDYRHGRNRRVAPVDDAMPAATPGARCGWRRGRAVARRAGRAGIFRRDAFVASRGRSLVCLR